MISYCLPAAGIVLLVWWYHQPQLSGIRLVAMALLLLAFGGAGINLTYLCHFLFVVSAGDGSGASSALQPNRSPFIAGQRRWSRWRLFAANFCFISSMCAGSMQLWKCARSKFLDSASGRILHSPPCALLQPALQLPWQPVRRVKCVRVACSFLLSG